MTTLISLLRIENDTASYQIKANVDKTFTALLIKSNGQSNRYWPQTIEIDLQKNYQNNSVQDVVANKLIHVLQEAHAFPNLIP